MGAVYRAEQISLKRIVALKMLRPELSAEPGMVRRFNAEAELAAKLSHPNTVTLFDFGQDAEGCLFIAMEYLEGRSLREVLTREGPLAPERALAICQQLCASLADAHSRGIVHRDLKPDNVMLLERGRQSDVVRVLDFGIAKLRDEGGVTAMPMTRAGDMLGTPQYMAPEQIRGEKVDARTDIYALGAILYEMVTGRLALEAATLMAILSKHLTEMPIPPIERRPDLRIPPALSHLVMEALRKNPAERPPTMDAFADRLGRIGADLAAAAGLGGYPPPPALPESPPPGVPLFRAAADGGSVPHDLAHGPPPGAGPYPSPAPGSHPYPSHAPGAGPYAAPGSSPGPYPSPAPYASTPAPGGVGPYPSPSPAPYAPSTPAPGGPFAPPYGAYAPGPPAVPGPERGPTSPARGRSRLWIAVLALVAAAAGVVAIAIAAQEGDEPTAAQAPAALAPPSPVSPTPPASSASPAPPGRPTVGTDFTIKPERQIYGSGESGNPAPSADSPSISSGAAQPASGAWGGGWWKDPTGTIELDVPKGFSLGAAIGGAAVAATFTGDCGGGIQCVIQTISAPTYGVQVDDNMLGMAVSQMQSQMGADSEAGSMSTVRVQGTNRPSLVFDDEDSETRGQLVAFVGSGAIAFVIVQAPEGAFDRTADFRKAFFEKRVRVR